MSKQTYSPAFENQIQSFELAQKCYNDKRYQLTNLFLQSIEGEDPSYIKFYNLKSQSYFAQGENLKALAQISKAFECWEANTEESTSTILVKIKLLLLRSKIYFALGQQVISKNDLEEVKALVQQLERISNKNEILIEGIKKELEERCQEGKSKTEGNNTNEVRT